MAIDADGANGQTGGVPVYAPPGYKPAPLDYLANAGGPGNWYGVVTNSAGHPVKQKPGDPAPGAYVSATSYMHRGMSRFDPRAYVDAASVIYIVLPGHWRKLARGIVLGCLAKVTDTRTGRTVDAAVLDFGPRSKLGEASIACAKYFGVPHSPKNGGTDVKRFIYQFFPSVPAPGYELKPM